MNEINLEDIKYVISFLNKKMKNFKFDQASFINNELIIKGHDTRRTLRKTQVKN